MRSGLATLLRAGQESLAVGGWTAARESFDAVLEHGEDADARFGLGVAAWWLGETEPALRHWERAYVGFRRRPDRPRAVRAAVYLCLAYRMSLGNDAAARGWLSRAERIAAEAGEADLEGWVLMCRAHLALDAGHPRQAEQWAREAGDVARAIVDVDLELCSLSELGAALVEQGRVEEGTGLLDEAMAAALAGEGRDLDAVVLISCRTVTACSRGGDLRRATQWVRAADDFHRRHGSPHLYTTCRTHHGSVLLAAGRWEEAEQELRAALQIGMMAEPALHAEARSKLAELRLAQGQPDEAARLLSDFEDHPVAAGTMALVHLARGEPALAATLLRRRLRDLDEECLEAAALQETLAEAELASGDPDQALARAMSLAKLGSRMANTIVLARGERALGRTLVATGDGTTAVGHLERAVASFERIGMPLESARSRLLLARALAPSARDAAVAEARIAGATFDELGAARAGDEAAALVRSLGSRAARAGPRAVGMLTRREREVLALLGEGLSNREIGDRLYITRKTVEHHVASVLSKVGLGGRGEAAAFAIRHLERDPASE